MKTALKRLACLAAALIFLLTLLPAGVLAEDEELPHGTCGPSLYWELDGRGTFSLYGSGKMTIYPSGNVPWTPVKRYIKALRIGSDVASISQYAFQDCDNLTSVTLPAGITSLGAGAFADCDNLETVVIGSGIEEWGGFEQHNRNTLRGTFENCGNLTSLTIKNGCEEIGYDAFRNCDSLETVSIPNSVKEIRGRAFYDCDALNDVEIGSRASIGSEVFYSCDELFYVSLSSGVDVIGDKAFAECISLGTITLPSTITAIGSYAFQGSGLKSITIPNKVKTLGVGAFADCRRLKTATVGSGITTWGGTDYHQDSGVFENCANLAEVIIKSGVDEIGNDAFRNCDSLESVSIPNSVESFGVRVFYDCDALTDVTLGDGIAVVSDETFYSCDELTDVSLSDLTTGIGANAFADCVSLTSIEIPDNVTALGEGSFSGCTGLTGITIPDAVKTIGRRAFYKCSKLKLVCLGKGLTQVDMEAFYGCSKLADVYYAGKETAWNKISIASSNDPLLNAARHYSDRGPVPVPVLKEVSSGSDGITVKWNSVPNATEYQVYRKVGSGSWELLKTVTGTSCKDTAVEKGVVYTYTVAAVVGSKTGSYSSAGLSIKATVTTLLKVSSVKADKTSAKIGDKITWTGKISGGVGTISYRFDVYKDGKRILKGSYGTEKTFSYTPTAAGSYLVNIFVKDGSGAVVELESAAVKVTSGATPGAIASVTVTPAAKGKITLSWSASADASAYIIQRRERDSSTWTTLTSTLKATTYTDTTGTAGKVYQYRVRGRNDALFGPFKTSAEVAAMSGSQPGAISGLTVTAAAGKVTLSWSAAKDAATYIIQRRERGSDTWTTLGSNVRVTTYTDTTGTAGKVYQYRVRSRNVSVYGPFKASVDVAFMSGSAPGDIGKVTVKAASGKITVSWSASEGAAAYILQRRVKGSDSWTTLDSYVTGTSYADSDVDAGTVYQYRVRGRNGLVYSSFKLSAEVTAQ